MAKVTIVFSLLLILLGVYGYVGAGSSAVPEVAATEDGAAPEESSANPTSTETTGAGDTLDPDAMAKPKSNVTALFPAAFGALLLICGLVALDESKVKHAMHAAAMFALLGTLMAAGRGAMGLGKFFSGDPSLNQRSFFFVWAMALLCGVLVFLYVQSFRSVRRMRSAEAASPDAS